MADTFLDAYQAPGLSSVLGLGGPARPFAIDQAAGFGAKTKATTAAVATSTRTLQEIQARIDAINQNPAMDYAQKMAARQQLEDEATAARAQFMRQVMGA